MNSVRYDIIKNYLNIMFLNIILDIRDRKKFVNAILDDVVKDIEETADWSDLEHDEICDGDIHIAVRRVLFNKFDIE